MNKIFDVAVIGAGVTGALTARELSRFDLKICLLEREADVAMGTTKANSAIVHAGYDAKYGTLKGKLNVRGNVLMDQVTGSWVCLSNASAPWCWPFLTRTC